MTTIPHSSDVEPHMVEEASLWARWRGAGEVAAREELIRRYLLYARTLAAVHYRGRHTDDIEFDEYLQLARLGLMESMDRYDPGQGAQFKTYAAHRIRGAILNGLEKSTEKHQQIIASKRLRAERLESVKAAALEATGMTEAAGGREVPPADGKGGARARQNALLTYLAEVGIGIALGIMLEDTGMLTSADDADSDATSTAVPSPEVLYFRKTEVQQWQQLLREALLRLPAQESRVIRYHYQQESPFDEIAALLGVSRSRVSQLHRQALGNLRRTLGQGPLCDVFL